MGLLHPEASERPGPVTVVGNPLPSDSQQVIPAPARPDLEAHPAHEEAHPANANADVDAVARASFVLGVVALVAVFVPPGLFAAPACGLAAAVLGVIGCRRASRAGQPTDRAVAGIVLGLTALAVSAALLWTFRHLIGHVMHQIQVNSARGW